LAQRVWDATRETSLSGFRSRELVSLGESPRLPDGSAIRREEAAVINAILARLPPDYRRVLELRYWGGLSFVAIAPEMGRSPDAVRKLWYRALEQLQGELAATGSEWTVGGDWSGGTVMGTTGAGAASSNAVAIFGDYSLVNGLGIDMSASAANGALGLGAIVLDSASGTLRIGNSSADTNGVLQRHKRHDHQR